VAAIVGAVGVPHTPFFPLAARASDPLGADLRRLYGEVAAQLGEMRPDGLILFTSDHYNLFFVESIPIFSIGVPDTARGPCDYPELPSYDVPIDSAVARELQSRLVAQGFDVGMSQEFEFDHAATVPLHFLRPQMDVPLVPVFVCGLTPPIPTAARCYELGRVIRSVLEEVNGGRRFAAVASGSFSLEIGGPRMGEHAHTGVPDPAWLGHVLDLLRRGEIEELVSEATTEQLLHAGNAAGELLNWIAMLGTVGQGKPVFLEPQPEHGHAYGVWQGDQT
jgi:aromatic ring-opening dioxygenase catalytic subunit (LigB family)